MVAAGPPRAKLRNFPMASPLAANKNLQRLVFADERGTGESNRSALDDELYSLPHAYPDGKSILVPAEAVENFTGGLQFSAEKMMSRSGLRSK